MSLLPIDSIDIGERFRRDMGDLPALDRRAIKAVA